MDFEVYIWIPTEQMFQKNKPALKEKKHNSIN